MPSYKKKPSDHAATTREYRFRSDIWKHKGVSAWYFVTLPQKLAAKIRDRHGLSEEGWGRLKVLAQVGESTWQTAIWFDSKHESYLLPIKALIRKKERLKTGARVSVRLQIDVDNWIRPVYLSA